jgi:hypothetical protein
MYAVRLGSITLIDSTSTCGSAAISPREDSTINPTAAVFIASRRSIFSLPFKVSIGG